MSDTESWPRDLLFKNLRKSLSRMGRSVEVASPSPFQLERKKVRIALDALPFQLALSDGTKRLRADPETALGVDGEARRTGNLLLFDPETDPADIRCFLRLEPGQTLTLGRDSPNQVNILGLGKSLANRHLTLTLFDDELVLKNHEPDTPIAITPLDPAMVARAFENRVERLAQLKGLFGERLEPMDPDPALALLEEVNHDLETEAHRPTDRRGKPGGLVSLPEKTAPFLVGGLHGRIDNLLVLLSQPGLLDCLESGRAGLVFLGNATHPEEGAGRKEMDDSLVVMDMILRLKLRYPGQVFYIRGSLDDCSESSGNGDAETGTLWRRHLRKARGKRYRKAMARFYDLIPYVIGSRRFLACHAGAPASKVDREVLINVREYPLLERELRFNRLLTSGRQKGYGKADVKRLRKRIGLPDDAPFVTAPDPLEQNDTLCMNVEDIPGHHLLFSGYREQVGAMSRAGNCLVPLKFPAEPLQALYDGYAFQDNNRR